MNPHFVEWWRSIGVAGQITFIVAVIGGFFGVLKVLVEKHPKAAAFASTLLLIGVLAFLFWPAKTAPVIPSQPPPVVSEPKKTPYQRPDPR